MRGPTACVGGFRCFPADVLGRPPRREFAAGVYLPVAAERLPPARRLEQGSAGSMRPSIFPLSHSTPSMPRRPAAALQVCRAASEGKNSARTELSGPAFSPSARPVRTDRIVETTWNRAAGRGHLSAGATRTLAGGGRGAPLFAGSSGNFGALRGSALGLGLQTLPQSVHKVNDVLRPRRLGQRLDRPARLLFL